MHDRNNTVGGAIGVAWGCGSRGKREQFSLYLVHGHVYLLESLNMYTLVKVGGDDGKNIPSPLNVVRSHDQIRYPRAMGGLPWKGRAMRALPILCVDRADEGGEGM